MSEQGGVHSDARSHDPGNQGRRYWDEPSTPLFPFGHGLTYGRTVYSTLTVDHDTIPVDGTVTVCVEVGNASAREVDVVVQLYRHQRHGSASRRLAS